MNSSGKKQLINSLTMAIDNWLQDSPVADNTDDARNIGYISDDTAKIMAALAITGLELSCNAQDYMLKEGYRS